MSRSAERSGRRLFALASTVIGVVLLVVVASVAASEGANVRGVSAVAAAAGRVYVAAGVNVVVADEEGNTRGRLLRGPGEPWTFGEISSIAADASGRVVVCDRERREFVVFAKEDAPGRVVRPERPPSGTFEAVPLEDGFALADTIGNEVELLDDAGRVRAARYYRYPNGLVALPALPGMKGPVLAFAHTGVREIVVLDGDLAPRAFGPLARMQAFLADTRKDTSPFAGARQLMDLDVTPGGLASAVLCRRNVGGCLILNSSANEPVSVIADLAALTDDPDVLVDEDAEVTEVARTGRGALLVAMPRITRVVELADSLGRTPEAFCTTCGESASSAMAVPIARLDAGTTWPNGTGVRTFGDDAIRRISSGIRKARTTWDRVETVARGATTALGLVLLVLLVLLRQTGAGAAGIGDRWRALAALWSGAERPRLVRALVLLGTAWILGAVLGAVALGPAGAAAGGAAIMLVCGRWMVVPRLVRDRNAATALAAWRLQSDPSVPPGFALGPDERVLWACWAHPVRARKADVVDAKHAAEADPISALEAALPALNLVVSTSRRLIVVETSVLGVAISPVVAYEIDRTRPADGEHLVLESLHGTRAFVCGPGALDVRFTAETATIVCERCGESLDACAHGSPRTGLAILLSLVFPGLGHLAQGRFRRARSVGLVALVAALAFFHAWFPLHYGTLPVPVEQWLKPVLAYTGAVAVTLYDVTSYAARRRRLLLEGTTSDQAADVDLAPGVGG